MKMRTLLCSTLFVLLVCSGVLAQSGSEEKRRSRNRDSSADRPVVVGYGVGRFKIGPLLQRDRFEDLNDWQVQIQQRDGFPPATVEAKNRSLDCLVPGRGCTVWYKKKLPPRIAITYEVVCPTHDPPIDGVEPRDINQFWMASDPSGREQGLFDSSRYTGAFGTYGKMHCYYASTGGGRNTTTRMRRYPREVDGQPASHLALKDKDGQDEFLITPDQVMKIQLVAYDDLIQYIVDGRLVYQIRQGDTVQVETVDGNANRVDKQAIYDRKRFSVYNEGYFGFRMVGTHHVYRNFRVHTLEPDPTSSTQHNQQVRGRVTFDEVLKREDANGDGKVTEKEFKGPKRLFQRMDRNRDGVLMKADFDNQSTNRNRTGRGAAVPPDVTVERDVVFGTGGGRDLTMHLVLPKKSSAAPRPVFVWIHGGGWQGGTKEGGIRQVASFVQNGFVGATIEYRLTGEAPFPAQIEDCKCAIRYLRAYAKKYNLNPNRIAVSGSSAGGHLVALLGTSGGEESLEGNGGWADQSSTVQAVVDLYGPTDFKAFVTTEGYTHHNRNGSPESKLLGGGEVLPNVEGIKRVNPITYVDPTDPPFLIIHGTKDRTVPLNQSEALHAALKSANVDSTLHIIEGAGHGGPEFSQPKVRNMIRDFVLKHLGAGVAKRGQRGAD